MAGFSIEDAGEALEGLEKKVDKMLQHESKEKEEFAMGDIAGLMSLMQSNKGMDLPGLLALAKDKGQDSGFGGQGMFIFVFLLLFLFQGKGFGGLGGSDQKAFQECAGVNCQSIIGIHDRISAAQAVSTQGFNQLDTKLCSSIAETIAAVRNQGDRGVDATNQVSRQLAACCCTMEAQMATILCELKGVGRDIRESASLTNAKIELEALRAENARAAMECRLTQNQKDCCCEIERRFDRLDCKLDNQCKDQEIATLRAKLGQCENVELARSTAEAAVTKVQGFLVSHYPPSCGPLPARA